MLLEHKASKVGKVYRELLVFRGLRVLLVLQVFKVPPAYLEPKEDRVYKEPLVFRGLREV